MSYNQLISQTQTQNIWQIQTKKDQYILDTFIHFEYLLNALKLQYLLDCCEGEFNEDSQYLRNPANKQKIVNSESSGRAIKAYFSKPLRGGIQPGPLFKDRDPNNYPFIKEINEVNTLLQRIITTSENWFELYCEYVLIKSALHEFYVDVAYPENKTKYGYNIFLELNLEEILKTASGDKKRTVDSVDGKFLRDFVNNSLLLGLDPTLTNKDQIFNRYLETAFSTFHESFLSKRDEWTGTAYYEIQRIKKNMTKRNLSNVTQWDSYALCSFDSGPVFLRKRKEFLMPLLCLAISEYRSWAASNLSLRNKLDEIVKKDVTILLGSYWEEEEIVHETNENQTPSFFRGNKKLAAFVKQKKDELDAHFNALNVTPLTDLHRYFPKIPLKIKFQSTPPEHNKGKISSTIENLYNQIRVKFEGNPLIWSSIIEQKSKITYRGENRIGYPNKAELDMISLFKPTLGNKHGLRYRVYPYVLAGHFGLQDVSVIVEALPKGSIRESERENPHNAEIFIQGYFSNIEEIDRFLRSLTDEH